MAPDDDILVELARGYEPLSDAEREQVWTEGHVVLDTNVLLNVYRYSPATREKLLHLLRRFEGRLWVPHQAAQEYFRNRLGVLIGESSTRAKVRAELETARKSLCESLEKAQRDVGRREGTGDMSEVVTAKFDEMRDELLSREEERLAGAEWRDDPIHTAVVELLTGNVGPAFEDEELTALYREGERRYKEGVPPGFRDLEKPAPERYGDLVLWKQTLAHAREQRKPIILVSDEDKEDWVWRVSGQTTGPQPELVRELHAEAGVPMTLVNTARFMQTAATVLDEEVSPEVLSEVEEVEQTRPWRGVKVDLASLQRALQAAKPDPKALHAALGTLAAYQQQQLRQQRPSAFASHTIKGDGTVDLHLHTTGLDIHTVECVVTSTVTGASDNLTLVVNTAGAPQHCVFTFPGEFPTLDGAPGPFQVEWRAEVWDEQGGTVQLSLASERFDVTP